MEQPVSSAADDVREARAALIETLTPMTQGEVALSTFRAQHEGFRENVGVKPDSQTESYFRLTTTLTGPRWAGVPVTMQAGKRMGAACKEITVNMRHPEPCIMCTADAHYANRVVFTLEPQDHIEIVFFAKKPGFTDEVEERRFSFFLYEKSEKTQYVEEYGKLMFDAMRGDQTLFVSTREVDAGWRFIDPVIDGWKAGAVPLASYVPNTADIVDVAIAELQARERFSQVGICGLGKMGAGLARNYLEHGWNVVGWNRHHEVASTMSAEGLQAAGSLQELVAALEPPRAVWVMVPAGAPVDALLFGDGTEGSVGLSDLLAPGDVIIDGGNSEYADAPRRAERLAENGVRFLDCGTSGGPGGARNGACLMVGGDREVFESLEPMFADVSVPGGYRFFPGHGAGHFVKMVHNGIEYGMMQAIAEGFAVLHESPFELDLAEVTDVYQHGSVVESRLVGWLGEGYSALGDDLDGASGVVGHSGEGEWTIRAAKSLGVPVPVIEQSLQVRIDSETTPTYTGQVLTAMRNAFGGHGLGPGGVPRR
jgi:6-phosphogluconate dehydrogenase